MVFRTPVRRTPPPAVADEKEALAAWLDWHRATLLEKLDGLDEEQLRRPMVPSGTSLLGLVKHLTETEQGWFVNEYAQTGEPPLYETEDDPEAGFRPEPHETAESIVDAYLAMCKRSRKILEAADSLDRTVPNERWGRIDLRRIVIHMIEETARHNGHADIVRELIDGATGD
ncbi:Protein of unknown function [Actinacidiphila yanglinensis]|uniref:DinB family protein n=1 Tax=Actinacidiphila yanglinensis TaxID=310779 RepID=A0A1H6DI64_9ACTN|nr:DinB family protein [Actinacidiphila yanglinensis]SEG84355.1 Protein of unknown function [Actinacidiphila yanglinensis]